MDRSTISKEIYGLIPAVAVAKKDPAVALRSE